MISEPREPEAGRSIDDAFSTIFENAPWGVCILGLDERLRKVNGALCQLLGFSAQELCGAKWKELTHRDDLEIPLNAGNNVAGDPGKLPDPDRHQDAQRRLIRRDGETVWTRIRVSPVRDSHGISTYLAVYVEDISEGRRMHAALRESEDRFRRMADNCPSMMWVTDSRGAVQFVNRAYRKFCGIGDGETSRHKWERLLRAADAPEYSASLQRAITGRSKFKAEARIEISTGVWRLIGSTAEPCVSSRGDYLGHVRLSADITEREHMKDALREAEQRYRGIFDKAIVGIFQSTPEGRFVNVNPAMAFILGYDSPEEMIAHNAELAQRFFVDPRQNVEFMAIMDRMGGVRDFECEIFRKDGNKVWLAMNIRAIREEHTVVRYEGMCEDVTERKQLRTQLLHAQKLESVGQLAAGIAHEINTPTQYIGDNTKFLMEAFRGLKGLWEKFQSLAEAAKEDEHYRSILDDIAETAEKADAAFLIDEIPRAIDQALEGVHRVATLVSAMKEFSHPGTKEKIPVDLNHAIESTMTVSRNEWKYVADLETNFDKSLEHVLVLPAEFNQVILNLIVNAAHAIGDAIRLKDSEKGKITVQTRSLPRWAEICISDTGAGIPEGIRNRVFDPFFTTKEIGKGTGQGLAIAHSVVVDKHSGTIRFETEEGKGTTFIIRLLTTARMARRED